MKIFAKTETKEVNNLAGFTRKAIKETFITLLEERPLSEITVKDIVETCGINRNSFYYHFRDIPALIDEIVKEEAESVMKKYSSMDSVVRCFDALIEFSSHRKRAIMHIYRSVGREAFESGLMSVSEYLLTQYFNNVFADVIIKEADRKTVIEYYKYVCLGLIIGWLNNGMSDDYARSIRRIFALKKDFAPEISEYLKDQV